MNGAGPEAEPAPVSPDRRALVAWAAIVLGAFVLAGGLLAARRWLPEWRVVSHPAGNLAGTVKADFERLGGRLSRTDVRLAGPAASKGEYEQAFRRLGPAATDYLARTGGAVAVEVKGFLEVPGAGSGEVTVSLTPDGSYRGVSWFPGGFVAFSRPDESVRKGREAFLEKLRELLAAGSPRLGDDVVSDNASSPATVRALAVRPGEPAETLLTVQPPGGFVIHRQLSDPDAAARSSANAALSRLFRAGLPIAVSVLLVLVLFGVLLYKRRLDFKIALALAGLVAGSSILTGVNTEATAPLTILRWAGLAALLAYLIAQWAVAESLLRDTVPGFTTSLDTLAAGRLGPRAGRAILAGLGVGAAFEGCRLAVLAGLAASSAHGVWPTGPSFSVPFFGVYTSPFFVGAANASTLVLFVALLRAVLPKRWADPAGALVTGALLSVALPMAPWGVALSSALAASLGGLVVLRRLGFASLLTAAVAAPLVRDTLAAAHLLPDSRVAFLVAAGSLGLLAGVGVTGVRRPPRDEDGRVEAPGYLRRLEAERRVRYEMDLLSRMQLALLPDQPPELNGIDIAVRMVLATEAGGDLYEFIVDDGGALWIAAGDVSGHGYSCGIQGAMVKAALASLVKAGRSPGEILGEVDRVLRFGSEGRLFTTLSLLRLDPATGQGVVANAGHPFPLLLVEGKCRELEIPGLPLGQGPRRTYADVPFELPGAGSLILASDGLYEGPDRFDEPYGYARPVDVLSRIGLWRRPAGSILEALFADWRTHVGPDAPADDTTILVVRRASFS